MPRFLALVCLLSLAGGPAWAEVPLGAEGRLKLHSDLRLRTESDWDSRQSDGSERADRDRLRLRLRLGLNYAQDEHLSFGGRLRTGSAADQQSPHQTLGDEAESKDLRLDRAYLRGDWTPGWAWAGKNAFPFWTQNELFWDEDVNPEGVAAGAVLPLGDSGLKLKPTAGYFLFEGSGSSNRYRDKAHLAAGQLAAEWGLAAADLSAAAGLFAFKDNPATVDPALADLNYNIWVLSAKTALKGLPLPVSLGLDFMRNARKYSSAVFNGDQRTGIVVGLNAGKLKEKGDWLAGYYYARIEKFAVVARLAQDDWLRWGSGTDTRSSNFAGHEFRLAYALGPSWNVVSRLYLVDALERESAAAPAREDGKRFRLDLNVGF